VVRLDCSLQDMDIRLDTVCSKLNDDSTKARGFAYGMGVW